MRRKGGDFLSVPSLCVLLPAPPLRRGNKKKALSLKTTTTFFKMFCFSVCLFEIEKNGAYFFTPGVCDFLVCVCALLSLKMCAG